MIKFYSQIDFVLKKKRAISQWILQVIESEGAVAGDISYVFCNDKDLHKMNLTYLNHDTYTDIISFDYSKGSKIHGEMFISIDRVKENALSFQVGFDNELHRVMIHGVLHLLGYKDKTNTQLQTMRQKENDCLIQLNNFVNS